ncbi:MAG: hypothetical protein V7752_17725, partial [Halopseudomonas sp.]
TPAAWQSLRPLMSVTDEATFVQLKEGYLAGIPPSLTQRHIDDAERMYSLLHDIGGERLMGPAPMLDRASFWQAP